MSWRLVATFCATGALAVSCHAALSLDDLELVDETGSGGTTSSSSSSGTGGAGGQGGVGGAACDPALCPGADTDCAKRACDDNDECTTENEPLGTACGPTDEQVCDDEGNCVECNENADCYDTDVCDNNLCVPATCTDQSQNGDETDVDCGGQDCAPCQNTQSCLEARDCVSGFCDNLVCAPCVEEIDCPDAWYCDADEECQPKRNDGDGCTTDVECLNGNCPAQDQVCCDLPCNLVCEACQAAKTGGTDGTCAPVTANDDFDGECADQGPTSCGPNGTGCRGNEARCNYYNNQTECRPAPQDCDVPEYCDGVNPACPPDLVELANTVVCRPSTHPICDPEERCDGSSPTCPTDATAQPGTSCDNGVFCDGVAVCDGSGACNNPGNPCPGPDGDTDCSESCHEPSSSCIANDPNNTSCGAGMTCHEGVCCHFKPTPPGGSCPGVCNGGCTNGRCIIACATPGACPNNVSCPQGWACDLACSGGGSCNGITLYCPNDFECKAFCSAPGACSGLQVLCSSNGYCGIDCIGDNSTCGNAIVDCGLNTCEATCTAPTGIPTLSCNNACNCTPC